MGGRPVLCLVLAGVRFSGDDQGFQESSSEPLARFKLPWLNSKKEWTHAVSFQVPI